MSKEFKCTQCMKKTITEREDTRHTDYSYGLCEECKPKPEEKQSEEAQTEEEEPKGSLSSFDLGCIDYGDAQRSAQMAYAMIDKAIQVEEKPNPLACKVCLFVAKTKGGLKLHKKVHK